MEKEKNQWAVITVEQYSEGVTINTYPTEEEANSEMHKTWERDMAVETIESSRKVDFEKSNCMEGYAELYYVGSDTPIKYFVEEVTDVKVNTAIEEKSVEIKDKAYKFGDKLAKIEWKAPVWTSDTVVKTNVKVIAIGEDFIGIVDSNGYANKIKIEKIIQIELKQD